MTPSTPDSPHRDSSVDRLQALLVLAIAPVVTLLSPAPSAAARALTTSPSAADPTAPLLAALALVAWASTGWLLLVVVTTVAAHLPGVVGRCARHTAERLAPAPLRALVRVAVGLSVATGLVGIVGATSAASAATVPPAPHAISFDWPGTTAAPLTVVFGPTVPGTPPSRPTGHPTATPARPRAAPPASAPSSLAPSRLAPSRLAPSRLAPISVPSPVTPTSPFWTHQAGPLAGTAARDVVVHSGDSLWSLAAAQLGPTATPARVARAWPTWWSANRAVIGDDPDLIHPGIHLLPPAR